MARPLDAAAGYPFFLYMFVYSKVDDMDRIRLWGHIVSTITSIEAFVSVGDLYIYVYIYLFFRHISRSSSDPGISVVSIRLLDFEFDFG